MKLKASWRLSALAGSVFLAQAINAQGNQGITVEVNGQPVTFQYAQPQMMGDRVMVPLRGVLEQLGATVNWNSNQQQVTATNGPTTIVLHIGDRTAVVNGQTITLDQPAVVVNDTTLVPIRFMSETLGADVQWSDASETVNITTGAAQKVETEQTTQELTNVSSNPLQFTDDLQGWTSNRAVHFNLNGPPGGEAYVVLPGLSADVLMQETSAGHYEATYTPDPSAQVSVLEGSAVAKLTLNGKTYYSTTITNMNVDTEPPIVQINAPQPNAVITGFQPQIDVRLSDAGSGVDPGTVHLSVNGQDVTANAKVTPYHIVYDIPQTTPGQYQVALSVTDKAGNTATKNWTFSLSGNSYTSDFTHTGRQTLHADEAVNFTLKAPPGSQVTVFLGNGRQVAMAESSPGVFNGTYTVRRFDQFAGDPVTATITPPNGQAYTIQAHDTMGISANLPASDLIPVISSPLASDTVSDPLVVTGTAPPTSTVYIHVSYESVLNDHQSIRGELADLTVGADSGGNWQTRPISIRRWMQNGDVVYHIRASVRMPDGTESAVTELRIHQKP